jgi:hypothetical protein
MPLTLPPPVAWALPIHERGGGGHYLRHTPTEDRPGEWIPLCAPAAVLRAVADDLEKEAGGWSAALEANTACALREKAAELRTLADQQEQT